MDENFIIHDNAGLGGYNDELFFAEYKDLHTYVERPDDFYKYLYAENRVLNHAHFYEWDEWEDEDINEKLNYLHRLIMQEIIDFCKRNNIEADYVSLDADHLLDSIKFGKWHPGTDSSIVLYDKNKDSIIESL